MENTKIIQDSKGVYWECKRISDPYFWDDDELLCASGDWWRKIKEVKQ